MRPLAIVLLSLAAASGSSAQITPALVKTGLYVFYGGGGNSLLRLTGNGLIVIDGKLPGEYKALMKAVNRIEDQPVRVLINTNALPEHSANNAQFRQAGAQILAQENAKNSTAFPATKTYDRQFTLQGGGIELQLLHFGDARTNGDTVVYFPDLKVVAVGDLLSDAAPDPDYQAGGSVVGWGPVLDRILKLDFDTVVPGAGHVATRADLEKFRAKIGTLVSRASALIKEGVSKDQLMSRLDTSDLGWHFDFTGDRLDRFYADVSQAK
jgi:glyoxylase-like metal-dependent hydrolase (beta-lactamase superfamily II)